MSNYKDAYTRYMDQNGIKYQNMNDDTVRVIFTGDNIKTIPVSVFFDKEGKNLVEFACFEVASFKDDKFAPGIMACNQLNAKYRWVKFYLDSDQDICVEADAVVDIGTVGEECDQLVRRIVGIVDEAYPELMKAMWK